MTHTTTTTTSTPDLMLVGLAALALVGVLLALGSARRGARKAAAQARGVTTEVTRMGGTLARAVGTGAVIVGAQWAVIASTTDPRAWGLALGLPALLAGSAVARLFAVTTVIHTGGHVGHVGHGRGAR
jgi:hypothetical protein